MVQKHNGILLNQKKRENSPFAATWMDLEDTVLSERSQMEEDKYCMYDITEMWNLRNTTN